MVEKVVMEVVRYVEVPVIVFRSWLMWAEDPMFSSRSRSELVVGISDDSRRSLV